MKFCVIYQQTSPNAQSPVRVVEQATGRGVSWINRYLDREYVRRLANTTLCTYAYNLLHVIRWRESVHYTGDIREGDLTESTLLDYVRFQSSQSPRPSPSIINDRVAVVDRAIRNEIPDAPCQIARGFHQAFLQRKPMGLGRPRLAMSRLRILPRTGLLARDNSRLAHRPYMSAWHCHESVPHLRNPIKQAGNLCPAAVSNPWVCRSADAPSVLRFANRMLI
jgi:hypothetical protein